MLIRSYIQQIDIGNCYNPFIIQNACSYEKHDADIADPTDQEIAAPGLNIRPLTDSESRTKKFWSGLSSAYIGQDLPADVVDAMQGKESPWKIVRCTPKLSEKDGCHAFFVLVNPTTLAANTTKGDNCKSVEQDVRNGVIWARLKSNCIESGGFDVVVRRQDAADGRYTILMHSYYFEFIEYYADGSIKRRNEVRCAETGEDLDRIYVTEYT